MKFLFNFFTLFIALQIANIGSSLAFDREKMRAKLRKENRQKLRKKRAETISETFTGTLEDLRYFNDLSKDQESIRFKLKESGVNFTLRMKISDKTTHTYPLVSNGSAVKLEVKLKKYKYETYKKRRTFYLDPSEVTVSFKPLKNMTSEIDGIYQNHHVKEGYSYIRIKNAKKVFKVYVYDKKALKALKKINPKRGCEIHIDGVNFIGNDRYYINRDFQIKSLLCN